MKISSLFPRYTDFSPSVPVWCVTPNEGRCFHRFFDTSPFSPSGRFLASLRMPREDRLPRPGEMAHVVLTDLETAKESVVAQTAGWESQMGANINWGATDEDLIFTDVDLQTWKPVTVKLNPHTGKSERFGRGVYHVSPDGKWALCCALEKMRRTQHGYGVVVPDEMMPVNWEPSDEDGLFLTDLESGQCRLLVSLPQLLELVPETEKPALSDHCYYGFHCKWAPSGDRILVTVRGVARPWALSFGGAPLHYYVFTLKPDGSELVCALDATFWNRTGHHINFYPDGKALSMNHQLYFDDLLFVRCDVDGGNRRPILEAPIGSGHPTVHPDGRHLLTDCYINEPVAFGDGTIPLRWIDMESGEEEHLARISVKSSSTNGTLRIDPHPAWDRTWSHIAFNGTHDGTRRVFVADLHEKLGTFRKNAEA